MLGSVPTHLKPHHPKEISLRASTKDLSRGSTKLTNHLPGYRGFIPADKYNTHARQQSAANSTRLGEKSSVTLNVGKEMVPGYGGYRPGSPSFNENRSFSTLQETTYTEGFFREPSSASELMEQRRERAEFARVLNPWNVGGFNVS